MVRPNVARRLAKTVLSAGARSLPGGWGKVGGGGGVGDVEVEKVVRIS